MATCLVHAPAEVVQEVANQVGDVFAPFAQRRHVDRKDVEPIERSARKRPRSIAPQIAMGGGDEPTSTAIGSLPPNALDDAFLQDPQQHHLHFRRQARRFRPERACPDGPAQSGRRAVGSPR